MKKEAVNHPPHYISNASGIECIDIVQHLDFSTGNAIKYLFRAGSKSDEVEDLEKALWYVANASMAKRWPKIDRRTRKAVTELVNHWADNSSDPFKAEAVKCIWLAATSPRHKTIGPWRSALLGVASSIIQYVIENKEEK